MSWYTRPSRSITKCAHVPGRSWSSGSGAFVLEGGDAWLVLGGELLRWTPSGYTERRPWRDGDVALITPPSLVEVLRAGWQGGVPFLHPSA